MDLLPPGSRVLLHACCGPCSLMPIRHLRGEGLDVTAYFFNPNIHPADEYEKRRAAMRQAGEMLDLPVLFDPQPSLPGALAVDSAGWVTALKTEVPRCLAVYDVCGEEKRKSLFSIPADAVDGAYGLKGALTGDPAGNREGEGAVNIRREGVRCVWCYRVRMEASARLAKARGFAAFTSSLLYSRYQHHELIVAEAERAARLFGVPFLYRDFREYWQEGIDFSKELGLYRQKWCGCILSMAEAEAWKTRREERRAALRAARRAEHEANAARKQRRHGA